LRGLGHRQIDLGKPTYGGLPGLLTTDRFCMATHVLGMTHACTVRPLLLHTLYFTFLL
jgi:hypothetical protein